MHTPTRQTETEPGRTEPQHAQHAEPWRAGRGLRWGVATLLLLALLAALAITAQRLRPLPLPEAAIAKLPCVSYAPFRRAGHTPFDAALRVSPPQIEADLRLLARVTGCVRTYGLDHGLDAVPAIARRLGLRVMLGAWIGRDAAANEDQLARALALAREHADVVDLLIVGNEVLLRRELGAQALAALLARAKRESPVPVGYADVWEFWLRHAALIGPHVHRVVAHVLPYWEDEPVHIDDAVAHVHAVTGRLRTAFAPLPVWVGETGWPAEGRQRGPARPGRAEQARFVREMLVKEHEAAGTALRFNLIEGFDQPWKRRLEGAMGGYWGLFDAEGALRVPLAGALAADEPARAALWAAAAGALAALLAALLFAKRFARRMAGERAAESPRTPPLLGTGTAPIVGAGTAPRAGAGTVLFAGAGTALLAGAGLGLALALQWQSSQKWVRSWDEAAFAIGWSLLAVCCVMFDVPRLAKLLAGTRPRGARPGAVAWWRAGAPPQRRLQAAGSGAWLLWLFGAAWVALVLVFDGRYRPLLWPMAWLPALTGLALVALGERLAREAREERLLAAVCGLAAVALLVVEGLANHQAWLCAGLWLAVAVRVMPSHRAPSCARPVDAGRAQASAENSTPAAAGPAE